MYKDKPEFIEPVLDVLVWFRGLIPSSIKRPRLNFIAYHYIYLVGLTIIASVIMLPKGPLRYIDSLFFAAGAATQSGLNTTDMNDLHTFQQVILYLIGCIANPIFINTAVVFVRLYWFEKRFQGIVQEANKVRTLRPFSRTRTSTMGDLSALEHGVNGRSIKGMGEKGNTKDRIFAAGNTSATDPRDESEGEVPKEMDHFLGRNPLWRLETKDGESEGVEASSPRNKSPSARDSEHHIKIVEMQRKHEQGALRIPGPRDFDAGHIPHEVSDDERDRPEPDSPQLNRNARQNSNATDDAKANGQRQGIKFDTSTHPKKAQTSDSDSTSSGARSARFNPLRPWSVFFAPKNRLSDAALQRTLRGISNKGQPDEKSGGILTENAPYLSWEPTIARNSTFVDLSEEQREELGGIEFRALKTLAIILLCYFFGFHLLGIIVYVPWILRDAYFGNVPDAVGQSRVWWGIFTPASMFNDLGFTLTPDSMISFNSAVVPLLLGSFLIIIGNTGFPCMLRFTIWFISKFVNQGDALWEELRFLLDHPRRCFTLLFPSKATWVLFWLLVLLNGIDLFLFVVLDLHDPVITVLPPAVRVLDGFFQAASTRTAGFAVVSISALHPAIQVSYLIMMYISVFPIAISVRKTNVYEEKSLGIWAGEEDGDEKTKSYVGQHVRLQLSFDLWFIFLGLFIIAICESGRLQNATDAAAGFTLFNILFEIVSAYGTVGLSLGYGTTTPSFSGQFNVLSKLIIIAMMIRGRHRGLPYGLDRAILLPSEALQKREAEEASRAASIRRTFSVQRNAFGPMTEEPDFEVGAPLHAKASPDLTQRWNHVRTASDLQNQNKKPKPKSLSIAGLVGAALSAGPTTPASFKKE